jgi:hypothetical protein
MWQHEHTKAYTHSALQLSMMRLLRLLMTVYMRASHHTLLPVVVAAAIVETRIQDSRP